MQKLKEKRVALLVTDGFEQVEMTSPREALEEAGAEAVLIAPGGDTVKGWDETDWGDEFKVDMTLDQASPNDFDALVLPGGVMNPDNLRRNDDVLGFVRAFDKSGKTIASICHGPWTLIDAGLVEGRTMTSYHTIQTDLKNAGALWVDHEVVVDGNLITSRNPDDLPAFNRAMVDAIATGVAVAEQA